VNNSIPSPAPLFKETSLRAGFLLSGAGQLKFPSIYHPDAASLFREYFYLSTLVKAEG
jgi:hypothetical protein